MKNLWNFGLDFGRSDDKMFAFLKFDTLMSDVNYHLLKQVAFSLRCAFTAHFAALTRAPQAWLGSCERPQQNAHTELLSSPSERHLHNEDMRLIDRSPCDRFGSAINMLYAIPLLKLVAPLRKNDCGAELRAGRKKRKEKVGPKGFEPLTTRL